MTNVSYVVHVTEQLSTIESGLTVYDAPNISKKRIGSTFDGGYVIIDNLSTIYDAFISAGISNDINFELDFLAMHSNVNCNAYDGTIMALPTSSHPHHSRIHFHKMNIGPQNKHDTTNLHDILDTHQNIFLKMDIEGSEWDWLASISDDHINNIAQLVIEYHWILKNDSEKRFAMLSRIASTHYLVHLHVNNYAPVLSMYNDIELPDVFECTYVAKRLLSNFSMKPSSRPIPDPLIDRPCKHDANDVHLFGPPYVNK